MMQARSTRSRKLVHDGVMAYLPPVGLLVAYQFAAQITLRKIDLEISYNLVEIFLNIWRLLPWFVAIVVFIGFLQITLGAKDGRGVDRLRRQVTLSSVAEILFLRLICGFLFLRILQGVFLSFKRTIPDLNPFGWDLTLAAWDRALLLGTDPWIVTHAIFGGATATKIIDNLYSVGWFFVFIAAYLTAVLLPLHSRLRLTFLLAFSLNWIVGGTILATIFSSAGPVYVEPLFGESTFAPLVDKLTRLHEATPLAAVSIQADLWRGYLDPSYPALGISAFPSLHVCIATTIALLGWGFGRLAGVALSIFAMMIFVGSIHLGWHYAVDGLAGILLAGLCWLASRHFTTLWLMAWQRDPEHIAATA